MAIPPRRNLSTIPAFLVALGLGLVSYYGVEWYYLPQYSEADIATSTELNLHLDLQRRGPHLQPKGEELERLRKMVRAEIEGEIRRAEEKVQTRFGIGLISLIFGLGQFAAGLALRR